MTRFLVSVRRLAMFAASLLLLAQLAPSVALACEGGAEEQRVTLTPIERGERNVPSGTRTCENARREVIFTRLEQWCEYEVKNNTAEEVTVESREGGYEVGSECARLLCLGTLVSIRRPFCEAGGRTRLRAGRECYVSAEYVREPRARERTLFRVRTRSVGNVVEEPTATIIIE
jgi:hypothetical protein